MSTATMHFGPEWMRTKNQPLSRSQLESSPPLNALPHATSTLATYSALVSVTPVAPEKVDESHPFRYSKEELLAIYQEGGKGGLGLEVDRWEGVVREVAVEPVTLREMTDAEKKLFAGSLNSEMRRRPSQSADYLSSLNTTALERPRMMVGGSATGSSPLRERFGAMKRKDSGGGTADPSSTPMPRKPSLPTPQVPGVLSTSPRTRHTSNFDGVLNSGELWMSRRRFSEASVKASHFGTEIQGEDSVSKPGSITEVKEEDSTMVQVQEEDGPVSSAGMDSAMSTSHSEISVMMNTVDSPLDLTGVGTIPTTYHEHQEMGRSPVMLDLAAVQWSYKDPTGQVQGPFRADVMQKWYEDGYFTPDLPMKRTHLDLQWSSVQELITRATGPSVFLTPPLPAGPPGLRQQPPRQIPERSPNEPIQPAPIRLFPTLESSLIDVSLASNSPPSSFNASHLGNFSPESSTFTGRNMRSYGGIEADGRISSFGLNNLSPSGFVGTRSNSNDFVHDSTTFEGNLSRSLVPDLDVGLNGHVFNNHPPVIQDSWNGFQNTSFGITTMDMTSRGIPPTNIFNDGVARGYGFDLGGSTDLANFARPQPGPIASNPVNYAHSHELAGSIPFTGLVGQQSYAAQIPDFGYNQQLAQTPGFRIQEAISPHGHSNHNGLPSGQSPWSIASDSGIHASMTVAERLEPTILHAPKALNGAAVKGTLSDETSASPLNVEGQHKAPQELAQLLDEKLAVCDQKAQTASASVTTLEDSSEVGKSPAKAPQAVTQTPSDQVALSDNSLPKSAWTKDDEGKGKRGTTASISLRAIQEAEAKKQQSLKASEREKERNRANITSEAKEDSQPFTASWGLPISQAGARNVNTPTKDVPALSAATIQTSSVTPVWTTPAKAPVVKKSMKEIQEEEERRKRQAAKDISVATTKRAYAETTNKTPSSIPTASSNTNPWTTVGSNGKAAFQPQPQPSRAPAPTTSFSTAVSGPSVASRSIAPPIQRIATTSPIKMRPIIKPGEVAETPSHEFLKWLGDSLKGLNSSANVEEIMSMLFSFPLDPDASTLEIISDTIYANSTTLDGRRFAADFVAKRKADAAARSKGSGDTGKAPPNKPVSIADVVKAVPKSTQPEWGFKVVNKKKKGGRS